MKGKLGWIVALLLALGIAWAKWGGDSGDDLLDAVASGKITVAVSTDRPDRAQITINRASGTGELSFTLPAGSVIAAGNDHTQRLMTASKVDIHLAAGATSAEVDVDTYCLDQFKAPPLTPTTMSFVSPQEDIAGDTSENAKLAACLQDGDATLRRRQVALWLVKGGYLDKSYDDATDDATRQFEEELSRELQDRIGSEFAARLRQAKPGISDAEVQRQIARFTPDKLRARVHDQAVSLTRGAFGHAKADASALLEKCGYHAATALFFATAPEG